MNIKDFETSPSGNLARIIGGEYNGQYGFVPNQLPPNFSWDTSLVSLLAKANHALGTLSGLGERLPNPHLFITPFIRREAVMSSRIEGTQSTISDLLIFEATNKEVKDVQEVQNYVTALEYGLKRVKELPLGLRLIKEIHSILMKNVRGEKSRPGEFRTEPNWIGPQGCKFLDATFVPPPVPEMMQALNELEKFFHVESEMSPLIRIALAHYQFEAIHPFLDGNGRIGRLLITFFLCERNLIAKPLFYLSPHFERNRETYNRLLLEVSKTGAWIPWIKFFLEGVVEQSNDAIDRARKMISLQEEYRQLAQKNAPPSSIKLIDILWRSPILSTNLVLKELNLSWAGANIAIKNLVNLGILKQIGSDKRTKLFSAPKILAILE
jgi:Fic family protein